MKDVLLTLSEWKFWVGFEPTISFNPFVNTYKNKKSSHNLKITKEYIANWGSKTCCLHYQSGNSELDLNQQSPLILPSKKSRNKKQQKAKQQKPTNNMTLNYLFTKLWIESCVNITLPEWNSGLD